MRRQGQESSSFDTSRLDVDQNGQIEAKDAALLIDHLKRQGVVQKLFAEGEGMGNDPPIDSTEVSLPNNSSVDSFFGSFGTEDATRRKSKCGIRMYLRLSKIFILK